MTDSTLPATSPAGPIRRWNLLADRISSLVGHSFLALLARHDERTKSAAVQYVVLSDPDGDGARIMVVRTDGELVYSGELSRPRGLLSFAVRDIARRGTAPTNVKGHLTTRGVELEVSIPFGRRIDPSTGEEVVVPR